MKSLVLFLSRHIYHITGLFFAFDKWLWAVADDVVSRSVGRLGLFFAHFATSLCDCECSVDSPECRKTGAPINGDALVCCETEVLEASLSSRTLYSRSEVEAYDVAVVGWSSALMASRRPGAAGRGAFVLERGHGGRDVVFLAC